VKLGLLACLARLTPLEEGDFPPIEKPRAESFDLDWDDEKRP
jgi:hypothetical protein